MNRFIKLSNQFNNRSPKAVNGADKRDKSVEFSTKSYNTRLREEKNKKTNITDVVTERVKQAAEFTKQGYSKYLPVVRDFVVNNRIALVYATVGLLLFVAFIGYIRGDTGVSNEVLSETTQTPLFSRTEDYNETVLTPGGSENTEDVGLIFDPNLGVASYVLDNNGSPLVVSQQPTPEDLISGQITLKDVASSIFDKQSIDQLQTDKGVIYLINTENKDQTVVMNYNGLLLFINSEVSFSNENWINLINELN